jgi:hypothetical protein
MHHAYGQTDGTYKFPNSFAGDQLKQAKKEIESLLEVVSLISKAVENDDCFDHGDLGEYITYLKARQNSKMQDKK